MNPKTSFKPPIIKVSKVTIEDHYTIVEVSGSLSPYSSALHPAALYDVITGQKEAGQLHKLIHAEGDVYTFQTFPPQKVSPTLISKTFIYRPWWTEDGLELVLDTSLIWTFETYPKNEDHAHCALTWETIANPMKAYRCKKHWITEQAYNDHIRDDIFKYRTSDKDSLEYKPKRQV